MVSSTSCLRLLEWVGVSWKINTKKGRVGLHVKIGANVDFSRMTTISPTSFTSGPRRSGGKGTKLKVYINPAVPIG